MSRSARRWPPLDTPPERRPPAPAPRQPSPWWPVAGVAAAALLVAAGSSRPGPSPEESIRAYACQHQTDAVLAWAEDRGVRVDVRECPPREEK